MASILVLTLDGKGDSRRLEAGKTLTIGRSEKVDWYLPDTSPEPTLSRQHCRFEVREHAASVTDLESRNGTWLNGEMLAANVPRSLRGGESLEIGPYRITVEWVR